MPFCSVQWQSQECCLGRDTSKLLPGPFIFEGHPGCYCKFHSLIHLKMAAVVAYLIARYFLNLFKLLIVVIFLFVLVLLL